MTRQSSVGSISEVGASLIGTTTAAAIRSLIGTIYSTTEDMTVYVDSAATGANNGTSWTDAFTTVPAAINSIPKYINHNVTILIRDGTYTNSILVYKTVDSSANLIIRGEYYWYGTVAATTTGIITLGSSDFGYADRAQIQPGDRVIIFRWSGAINGSTLSETYDDTVASVSGAEVTLTTNTGVSFNNTCTYAIVKTELTSSSGNIITANVDGTITIAGLRLGGTPGACVYAQSVYTNCILNGCYCDGFTSFGAGSAVPAMVVRRSLIKSNAANAVGISISGNNARCTTLYGTRIDMTGAGSVGMYVNAGLITPTWAHIAAAATGLKATIGGAYYNSGYCLNAATTPKSPASSSDPSYIG